MTESTFLSFCTQEDRLELVTDRTVTPFSKAEIGLLQHAILQGGLEPDERGRPCIDGAMGLTAFQISTVIAKANIIATHDMGSFTHITPDEWYAVGRLPLNDEGDRFSLADIRGLAEDISKRVKANRQFWATVGSRQHSARIWNRINRDTELIRTLVDKRYEQLRDPNDLDAHIALDEFVARELYKGFLRDPYATNAAHILEWAAVAYDSARVVAAAKAASLE
jgi:hypothetical protein